MLIIKIHDKLKPILRIRHRTGRLILYDIEKNGEKVSNVIKIIVFMTKKKAHLPNTKQTGGLFSMLS